MPCCWLSSASKPTSLQWDTSTQYFKKWWHLQFFLNSSVKNELILAIFGIQNSEETSHQTVIDLYTSSVNCNHCTLWKSSNFYRRSPVVDEERVTGWDSAVNLSLVQWQDGHLAHTDLCQDVVRQTTDGEPYKPGSPVKWPLKWLVHSYIYTVQFPFMNELLWSCTVADLGWRCGVQAVRPSCVLTSSKQLACRHCRNFVPRQTPASLTSTTGSEHSSCRRWTGALPDYLLHTHWRRKVISGVCDGLCIMCVCPRSKRKMTRAINTKLVSCIVPGRIWVCRW